MKPPYIKLYVKDFAFEIQGMTKKQIGEYVLKFLDAYRHESVPDELSTHSIFSELKISLENYGEKCEKNRKNIEKRYSKKNNDIPLESDTCGYQSNENGKPVEYLTKNQEPRTNNQEPNIKKKNIKKKKAEPKETQNNPVGFSGLKKKSEFEKPEDVSEEVWQGWLALRKAKNAPVTALVIKTIRKEAESIGWTLEQAVVEVCSRNWQGFKASWVQNDMARNGHQKVASTHLVASGMGGIPSKADMVLRLKNGAWSDVDQLRGILDHLKTLRLMETKVNEQNELQRLATKTHLRICDLTGEAPF